jgi:oligoendopeptidase F
MGHSMHTLLSHESQPFVYAGYTIFVAEVPSTLNEALFLDLMLERATSREERAVLLQHAIDSIAGTFYTQVLFADFELHAHRLVEQDQPVTAETLNELYARLLREYYGDVIDEEPLSRVTWARIPHFFNSPYYVYQYATCFASTARLMQDLRAPATRVPLAAAGRWQRLSDDSAGARRGRLEPARDRQCRGSRTRHARRQARTRARTAVSQSVPTGVDTLNGRY